MPHMHRKPNEGTSHAIGGDDFEHKETIRDQLANLYAISANTSEARTRKKRHCTISK